MVWGRIADSGVALGTSLLEELGKLWVRGEGDTESRQRKLLLLCSYLLLVCFVCEEENII